MSKKNFPGPYEVSWEYAVTVGTQVLTHIQRLNCNLQSDPAVGTAWSSIQVEQHSGAFSALSSRFDEYLTLLADIFDAGDVAFGGANLYKYEALSFVKNFRSSYQTAVVPVAAGAPSVARSDIITMHTDEGGEMRLVYLEANKAFLGRDVGVFADAHMEAIYQWVIGASGIWQARDTSWPASSHAWLGGQNEKVFRQRYR